MQRQLSPPKGGNHSSGRQPNPQQAQLASLRPCSAPWRTSFCSQRTLRTASLRGRPLWAKQWRGCERRCETAALLSQLHTHTRWCGLLHLIPSTLLTAAEQFVPSKHLNLDISSSHLLTYNAIT